MTPTATIVLSIIGAGIGVVGVLGFMLRMLTTVFTRELQANTHRTAELKSEIGTRFDETSRRLEDTSSRIDDTNKRIDILKMEIHQGFETVHRELGENRERMAKLEGALEGFLAGRRDRDAA